MKHQAFTKPLRRLVAALILAAANFGLANGSEARERVDRCCFRPTLCTSATARAPL